MVQCVHGQVEKNGKCTLAYIYYIYINIYKDKASFNTNWKKLYSKNRMSLVLVYSFHILLISRQKANTIHTLIIKYSHYIS